MLKKAAPALFATAVLLAGCNGDEDALPADNETPMEDIREGNDEMFDGNRNGNGNGDGMGGEGTNGPIDRDGTGPGFGEFDNDDGGGTDAEKREEIMEDDLDRNGNGGMGGGQ